MISEPFIRRPVATTLLMIGVALAGLVAYQQLPVAALPQVDYPTIVVSTQLPGASAETMASAVTTPLERQFGQMPSLTQMTSVSSFASSSVTLQFSLDRNIDAAEQDVQAAINAASNLLPPTLPAPPTYSKSNPADTPVLTLAVSSTTMPISQVDDYADSVLAQKISQVSGVGLVTINGGQKPAVRVQVDPEALAGANLTLEDVRAALVAANVNQPKGNLDGPRQDYTLATNDQLDHAAGFGPQVIAYKNGAPVRLGEVARVSDGVENEQLAGWAGDQRAIIINVQRQPGANLLQVTDHVKALLPQLRASMPQGIDVSILSDRTETVRASVADVQFTLVLTVFLVVLVIFVFLRSWRATVIPGVAVPLSLIATFGIMHLCGYSLNNLSLMALTISTGFVVDDAIVMVENISRYIEEGHAPFEAALVGAKQIGFTILSLTVSLIAVLIPLLFMGGLIGRLFREFAVTLSIAIAVSAVLSLTLTAMMCGWLLKPHAEQEQGRFAHLFERGFDAVARFYDRTLKWVLRHHRTTLIATIATIAATAILAIMVPKGFFPVEDTGLVIGVSEAAPDVSFSRMMERQQALADVLLGDPDVASVASFIGADGTNATTNSGRFSISLKPLKTLRIKDVVAWLRGETLPDKPTRTADATEIIRRLSPKLAAVDGITLYLQPVQDLQIDNRLSRTQYQYTLEDADPAELAQWGPKVLEKLRTVPELTDVASDQQTAGLQLALTIDRDTAGRLGITPQAIDDTLYDAFGQRQVSTIFTQLNLYRVILEVRPEDRERPEALSRIYVHSITGDSVPLSAFTHYETKAVALSISHQGQFPSVTLSFNTAPGVSLGAAVDAIHRAQAELGTPPSVHADFQGAAAAFRESLASEPILLLAALLTVYIVLGVLYESYIHPITILSTLPSAGVGALLALILCNVDFGIIALIGVILLVGIVKKNAIMMIDFALEAEREQKLSPEESIYKACLLRFRPIMMTTMAALLGALPLALGSGTGAELRRPLGITIVGGLLLSQILTLYTTPVIYLYMEKLARLLKRAPAVPEDRPAPVQP
ncbi:MAG TPA: multidrug efflux RND transporter permease subunit [Polyangia bacterium]|nr:multidrug efflux RND transporter permease subunit [Polyangia bacterium]